MKPIILLAIFASALTLGGNVSAQEKKQEQPKTPTTESLQQKASYLIVYDVFKKLELQGFKLDVDQATKGINDAAEGKAPPMTDEEIRSVMMGFERLLLAKRQEQMAKLADDNMRQGKAFLKKNLLEEGVKELENGLQFKELKKGTGETPRITDNVKVHYKGMFTNGTTFETTEGNDPVSLTVGGGMRAISNALQKMKVGDKWKLFIPSELAFGVQGDGAVVGPNQVLVYELELVEIMNSKKDDDKEK